jgi:hypothetical protein
LAPALLLLLASGTALNMDRLTWWWADGAMPFSCTLWSCSLDEEGAEWAGPTAAAARFLV